MPDPRILKAIADATRVRKNRLPENTIGPTPERTHPPVHEPPWIDKAMSYVPGWESGKALAEGDLRPAARDFVPGFAAVEAAKNGAIPLALAMGALDVIPALKSVRGEARAVGHIRLRERINPEPKGFIATYDTPRGSVQVTYHTHGDEIGLGGIASEGGPNSIGAGTMRQIFDDITQREGLSRVKGKRVSGANFGHEASGETTRLLSEMNRARGR